jgi:hypothetical protein
MLDKAKVMAKYWENYRMAIEDGHTEQAEDIAWDWTEQDMQHEFVRVKSQFHWQKVDEMNLALENKPC